MHGEVKLQTNESKDIFSLTSFLDSLQKILKKASKQLRFFGLIAYVFYAVFTFILGIKVVIEEIVVKGHALTLSLGVLKSPLIIYLVGTYCTPLPSFIVIPLVFFPPKMVMSFFGCTMVFFFFSSILI